MFSYLFLVKIIITKLFDWNYLPEESVIIPLEPVITSFLLPYTKNNTLRFNFIDQRKVEAKKSSNLNVTKIKSKINSTGKKQKDEKNFKNSN